MEVIKLKMRSLGWALIPYDQYPYKEEIGRQTHIQEESHVNNEDSHLQIKEKGLEKFLPSHPPKGTNVTDILILDVQPPEL